MNTILHKRTIRSFAQRQGRETAAQKRAWEELWPIYGVKPTAPLIFQDLFANTAPTILEIGFGNGHSLIHNALQNPSTNYLGIEVFRSGVAQLLNQIVEHDLNNVRVINADAVVILKEFILPNSLDGVQIFFPDPWPKTRHHKRRLIQTSFLELLAPCLKANGFVHLATDWEHYALHMNEVLSASPLFKNKSEDGDYIPRPESRLKTHFENRGVLLGHGVWDLLYERL
jgi:tRNA (guanine-N7-)-methyltransferase